MKAKTILKVGALAAAMGMTSLATAQVGSMTLYDDFNSKWTNPDKWNGGKTRADMETVWRMNDDGYLETGLRGFSDITTDEGRQKHRNSLYMNEDVAGGVSSIGVEAMVDWGYVRGCEGSDAEDSWARFRIGGFFFNSGGGSYCGDRTGDIWAQLWLRDRDDDGLKSDQYDVSATVWRCEDAKCETGTSMFFKRLGTVMEDEMTKMYIHWDEANSQFVFETSQGGVVYDYSLDMANMGDVSGRTYSKGIQTLTDVANCSTEDAIRPYAVIDASVDNYYVNADYLEKAAALPEKDCKAEPNCTICNPDPSSDEGACEDDHQGSGTGTTVDPVDNGDEEVKPMTAADFQAVIDGSSDHQCKVVEGRATRVDDWKAGQSLDVDNKLLGYDITAYQIQWFNGSWSGFYEPGKNDADWKTNYDGSERLVWSYFYDHNHRHIYCPAETTASTGGDDDTSTDTSTDDTPETAEAEVEGEWYQGYYCYNGSNGRKYTRKSGKWYSWQSDRFVTDTSGDAEFSGKKLKMRTGAIPAEQLKERKARAKKLAAERRAKRNAERAEKRAKVKAERAEKRAKLKAERKAKREAARKERLAQKG